MTPIRVAFLVNGTPDGVEAVRALGLSRKLDPERIFFLYRERSRLASAWRWSRVLLKVRPDIHYVLNTAMPGAMVALLGRFLFGIPYILDTGDAIHAMACRSGTKAGWRLPLLWSLERLAERFAEAVVVRGTNHREHLVARGLRRVIVIRDGYLEQPSASPDALEALRHRLGLDGRFVVGVMGSLVYSPNLDICYGWDLLGALVYLKDLPVTALIIGDGNGLRWLSQLASKLGVADRVVFCGRIPYSEVPTHLRLMEVALSTQTNNLPGQVRTTGKLPEYMAAERFILASRVGEAALLLPEIMLLDFNQEVDRDYPARLAERIRLLQLQPALLEARHALPVLARQECSYDFLSSRLKWVLDETLRARKGK